MFLMKRKVMRKSYFEEGFEGSEGVKGKVFVLRFFNGFCNLRDEGFCIKYYF